MLVVAIHMYKNLERMLGRPRRLLSDKIMPATTCPLLKLNDTYLLQTKSLGIVLLFRFGFGFTASSPSFAKAPVSGEAGIEGGLAD